MCGIAGIVSPHALEPDALRDNTRAMTDALVHRGPDGHGLWLDPEAGVGLGHRRLSIIDLSEAGAQPMVSACGRYVLVYNGEVYNHADIRADLEAKGHAFRGRSDTEVVLAAMAEWGVEDALSRFVGMFALALWDKEKRLLCLARDRLGIKPLYYALVGDVLLFGSELKALMAHPDFDRRINYDALSLYFRHNYFPAPHTVFRNARKLLPGHVARMYARELDGGFMPGPGTAWWSAREVFAQGAANPLDMDEDAAADELERLLADAVASRMIADVPLGAFLSGGIDSSTVVALMQKASSRPVKTFTIGFAEADFNEADHARAVAAHLGTEHTELDLTPADLLKVVPDIPEYWDEPFADVSQIPTYLVSRLARQSVTVSLSGDGGDELFLGYDRYFWTKYWKRIQEYGMDARRLTKFVGGLMPEFAYRLAFGQKGTRLRWRLGALTCKTFEEFYLYSVSHMKKPGLVKGSREPQGLILKDPAREMGGMFNRMRYWDACTYLPDDILCKVDRASMAVSLEARVPILDHRVVEFAARVPLAMNVKNGTGKGLLRKVLFRHAPESLFDRPKMGFGVPIEKWLKTDLAEWAGDLLSEKTIKAQGLLNPKAVARIFREFKKGRTNWYYVLWDLLMFQAWMERWAGGL